MQRFTKILYVNNPPSTVTAFQRAVQLARTNGADLTVISVGHEVPQPVPSLQKTFSKLMLDESKEMIGKVDTAGLNIHSQVRVGTPFLEVIREVLSGGHDLVIKPSEGRGGEFSILFGSTDLHLLRKCPCPVWIVKPSRRKKYTSILAAIDPDPSEKTNRELNDQILNFAISLAQQENSLLHVVHAWSAGYESMLRSGRVEMPKRDIDRMVSQIRQNHKKWLDELLSGYDLQDILVNIHLRKGKPEDVIPTLAQQKKVELIVMGTVARTGIPGFFIGNTAEQTLATVDCSVLAVKPKSFLTPVEV